MSQCPMTDQAKWENKQLFQIRRLCKQMEIRTNNRSVDPSSQNNAAVKRTSMELTRELARFRRGYWKEKYRLEALPKPEQPLD